MNKKIILGMIFILFAFMAVIPGLLTPLRENEMIVQYYNVACGSCHVTPSANDKKNPGNPDLQDLKRINVLPQPVQMGMPLLMSPGIGVLSPMFTSATITETPSISPAIQDPKTGSACEFCHKDAQYLIPHVNGGELCLDCHGGRVHETHENNQSNDCTPCHGLPPVTPKTIKGAGPGRYIICEKCHAPPPNSREPSNGDLIAIHMSRGKSCSNCHITETGHERTIKN